ncbi:MAG: type III pantothenate kinase [Synechococcaceae cyanobacterium]
MTASEEPCQPLGGRPRWLLIGNSRWHWAEAHAERLRCWHEPPQAGLVSAAAGAPLAWAAVGPVPAAADLKEAQRVRLNDIPLRDLPPWLGIDRALAGWQAWRQQPQLPVLVADAGTVLSFTRVDRGGGFRGGRLQAGLALQLRAMAAGTAGLPDLGADLAGCEVAGLGIAGSDVDGRDEVAGLGVAGLDAAGLDAAGLGAADRCAADLGLAGRGSAGLPAQESRLREPWPSATEAAMREGVARGLVAAIAASAAEVQQDEGECRLVLTGGDAGLLLPLLQLALGGTGAHRGTVGHSGPEEHSGAVSLSWQPELCLEALAELRPTATAARDPSGSAAGGPSPQARPRSLRI